MANKPIEKIMIDGEYVKSLIDNSKFTFRRFAFVIGISERSLRTYLKTNYIPAYLYGKVQDLLGDLTPTEQEVQLVSFNDVACHVSLDENDPVNHPAHYTTGNIEVIDFIQDKQLNFARGNAVKYIVRAGLKDPEKTIEDLEKAKWYIDAEIKDLKKIKQKECGGNNNERT